MIEYILKVVYFSYYLRLQGNISLALISRNWKSIDSFFYRKKLMTIFGLIYVFKKVFRRHPLLIISSR